MDVKFVGIHNLYAIELIDWFKQYGLRYDYKKTGTRNFDNTLIVYGVTKVCSGIWAGENQLWLMMTSYDEDQTQINQYLVKKVYFE